MITTLQGTLVEATPLRAVVELNGLGYEIHIPVTTAERLPPVGSIVKLHTLVIYREDSQTLYGFATASDRDFFRMLIEHVTGVGPKVALSIMSRLSLPLLESAISTGDVATLAKCPGIGKKTAERLIIELRGKLGTVAAPIPGATPSAAPVSREESQVRDAVLALTALGFKPADADQAVRKALLALGSDASTEQLVKKALGR